MLFWHPGKEDRLILSSSRGESQRYRSEKIVEKYRSSTSERYQWQRSFTVLLFQNSEHRLIQSLIDRRRIVRILSEENLYFSRFFHLSVFYLLDQDEDSMELRQREKSLIFLIKMRKIWHYFHFWRSCRKCRSCRYIIDRQNFALFWTTGCRYVLWWLILC